MAVGPIELILFANSETVAYRVPLGGHFSGQRKKKSRPHDFFDGTGRPLSNFRVSFLAHALFKHFKSLALHDALRDGRANTAEIAQGPDGLALLLVVAVLQQGADGINTPTFQHNVAVAGALLANAPYASGSQSLELVIRRWRIN